MKKYIKGRRSRRTSESLRGSCGFRPSQAGMNAQQTALVSFSRFLETHIQAMSLAAGKSACDVFKEAAQRLLAGLQSTDQTAKTVPQHETDGDR
jgi:hypothetical protein